MPPGSPVPMLVFPDPPGTAAPPAPGRADIVADVLAGLGCRQKTLPPKLFYDEEGCRLFGEITRLPEYYLTRTELALLPAVAEEVGRRSKPGTAVVEYGASHERKACIVLDALPDPAAYVPIDVAGVALAELAARLRDTRPNLAVYPLAADFLRALELPSHVETLPKLGFFPGSTIGNLDPAAARGLLAQARCTLGPGAFFLVGVDLRKDPGILLSAYDDPAGVTAAFNRNLLHRLNREAAADFDLAAFAHRAVWNEADSRIEMHLVSLRRQVVRVAGRSFRFAEGESIHTENSYKHTLDSFAAMARQAGWRSFGIWTDQARLFSLHLLHS